MDMYQKRKMRQEKNMKKNEGQDVDNKTNINWYIPTLINFLRKPYFTRFHI